MTSLFSMIKKIQNPAAGNSLLKKFQVCMFCTYKDSMSMSGIAYFLKFSNIKAEILLNVQYIV